MTESFKSSAPARAPKNPSSSYNASSQNSKKCDQQYLPVNREWAVQTKQDSLRRPTQYEDPETASSSQVDTQYLSPMERWEKENLHQSQWNNMAWYTALSNDADHVQGRNTNDQGDKWSTTGNVQSEK